MEGNHLYEPEISPKDIIKIMKNNIYKNYFRNNYHLISSDYLLSRSSLFSLIRKISDKMGFKSQTYFLSIYYLDILFSKNKKIDCNFKTLGLACLLLSAKFVENESRFPNLSNFIRTYNNNVGYKDIISVSDLFYSEVLACKMLEYKLNYYSVYDFDSFFFGHGIVKINQLKELNNGKYTNLNNNNFEINSSNSLYIKNILEKIYRKSRQYLEIIVNNSHICLKYNSLLISIFIMKKSVEEILFEEQRINKYDLLEKEKFINKTSKYFKEIMNEIYEIDYESIISYTELTADKDIIKIFQEERKKELSPVLIDLENNIKLANEKNDKNSNNYSRYNTFSNYKFNNNSLSNNNILISNRKDSKIIKINLTRNLNKYNNYKNLNSYRSGRVSPKIKNDNNSASKKKNFNYLNFSNLSSSKDLNKNEIKNSNQNYDEKTTRTITAQSDIVKLKFLHNLSTYNNLSARKFNESNSIKNDNIKTISIENDEDIIEIINSIDKNNNINENKNNNVKIESPIKSEINHNENLFEKYKKINILKKKPFHDINSYINNKEFSSSRKDNSTTLNIISTININEDENISKGYQKIEKYEFKPYLKKVIKNTTNNISLNIYSNNLIQHLSQKQNNNSNFSLIKDRKKREINSFLLKSLDSKEKKEKIENSNSNFKSSKQENNILEQNKRQIISYNNSNSKININKEKDERIKNNVKKIDSSLKNKKIIQKIKDISNIEIKKYSKNVENDKNLDIIKKNENGNENKYKSNKIKQNEENIKTNKRNIKDKEEEKINNKEQKERKLSENKFLDSKRYRLSSSSSFIDKKKESDNYRERLFFKRIRNAKIKKENDSIVKDNLNINENKSNKKELCNNKNDKEKNLKNSNNNIHLMNYQRRLKKNESKDELKEIKPNSFSKRKFFLFNKKKNDLNIETNYDNIINEKKEKLKENKNYLNKTEKNLIKNNNINEDNKHKSIRYKYINKMQNIKNEKNKEKENIKENKKENEKENFIKINKYEEKNSEKINANKYFRNKKEEKINVNKREIKILSETKDNDKEKTYQTSSIINLLNKTKIFKNKDNNIKLTNEELNMGITNNYFSKYNKRNLIIKPIRATEYSEDKDKIKNETTIEKKEIIIPKGESYKTIKTDINKSNKSNNNNNIVIHSYHYRNIYKNKIKNNLDSINNNSNKKLDLDSNKTTNTIVINNNININFNNKIEPIQGRFIHHILKRKNSYKNNNNNNYNKRINNSNNNIPKKTNLEKYNENNYNNKKRNNIIYKGGTIECNNNITNNNQNDSISSLLHKLPLYKKTMEINRNKYSRESSIEIKKIY